MTTSDDLQIGERQFEALSAELGLWMKHPRAVEVLTAKIKHMSDEQIIALREAVIAESHVRPGDAAVA